MSDRGSSCPESDGFQEATQYLDPKRVKEDLLALGIDVDFQVIGRMQKLGLNSTWSTTSKAANSLRKRNPYGVPSHVSYQNLADADEMSHADHREMEKEWSRVDQQRLRLVLKELENRDSSLPSSSRVSALKLVHLFKTQYNRSPDKFVSTMLAEKNKKGLIRAGQLLKTRFILHSNFSEIILRLHKQASADAIAVLFTVLSEDTEINGLPTKVLDLKAFLFLLKLANDDNRRSFDSKTSKVSNDVEFWNKKYPVRKEVSTQNQKGLHSSKGRLRKEYTNSMYDSSHRSSHRKEKSQLFERSRSVGNISLVRPNECCQSVAELMGYDHRESSKVGKGVKGLFMHDILKENNSVAKALNAVERNTSNSDHRKMLPFEEAPRRESLLPGQLRYKMRAGTGVSQALGLSNEYICPAFASPVRVTSVNEFYNEGRNGTSVPQALHFKETSN